MRLATSTIQFKQLTLEQAFLEIVKLGFEAVDINPFMHGHPSTEDVVTNLAKSCEYLKGCHAKLAAKKRRTPRNWAAPRNFPVATCFPTGCFSATGIVSETDDGTGSSSTSMAQVTPAMVAVSSNAKNRHAMG